MDNELVIRHLKTVEEHLQMEKIQGEIWCPQEAVPMSQTLTAVKNGGSAIGLYAGDDLVGFCYAFPGYKNEKSYLCSHMLGLKEQYRHGGWGEKLKLAQREEALNLGYDLITWTYDPLESPNANLNIAKLRATVRNYLVNCYGEMRSSINVGLPSDRFLAEWHITSDRIDKSVHERTIDVDTYIAQMDFTEEDPYLIDVDLTLEDDVLLFPIPVNFREIRMKNPRLALDWRMKAREVFEAYFTRGYVVTDFLPGQRANSYLLEKEV